MGYAARGAGDAVLKKGVDKEALSKILDEILEKNGSDLEYDFSEIYDFSNIEEKEYIDFWESDSHWHEEDTEEFLNALVPYITEGSAVYSGDDDCNWRYNFIDGKWINEDGQIFYSDKDIIEYLKDKGYQIIQNPDNATNGDVIKAIFPNIEVNDNGIIVEIYTDTSSEEGANINCTKDWWDTKYEVKDMEYIFCEETVKTWIDNFKNSGTNITEEIEEVKGTISNERLWQKGASSKEEIGCHEQNIADLCEYLARLEALQKETI